MKKTYKLFGVEWDHSPLPKECPMFIKDQDIEDWRKERTLFDLHEYSRKVDFSELISVERREMILPILSQIRDCDNIVIALDYEPLTDANAVVEFYSLRLLQIYEYIRSQLPEIKVFIMGGDKVKTTCKDILVSRQMDKYNTTITERAQR